MRSDSREHLSKITTLWTVLRQAQGGNPGAAQLAQEIILQRYSAAIFRYLLAAVKDEDAADELYQEFALRFVRGDFANADPSKGRFRHFLKRALFNLASDHYRARKRAGREKALAPEQAETLPEASGGDAERAFGDVWKTELLARAWTSLQSWQQTHGQPYYHVLRCRAENAQADSAQLAAIVSQAVGKPVSAGLVRNHLHHARKTFAELLVEEVRQTLVDATQEDLVQELIDLGLWERCKGVL